MGLGQLLRREDALIRLGRWHPDVGEDHVRRVLLDRGQQRGECPDRRDQLHVGLRLEQQPRPLTYEVAVLGRHNPDHHGLQPRDDRLANVDGEPEASVDNRLMVCWEQVGRFVAGCPPTSVLAAKDRPRSSA